MNRRIIFSIVAAALFFEVYRSLPAQSGTAGSKGQAQPDWQNVRLIGPVDGPALYRAYCAVCHGPDGRGTGPIAKSLQTPPADLTRIAARNGGVYPAKRVEKIIAGEEQRGFEHGTAEMPLWGPVFSQVAWDRDLGLIRIHNLAKYLETMQSR